MIVYTLTVERTASFWDCAEYIAAAYKLEVTHPPGAPLFLLLGRMFSFLAGKDFSKVAFWINMSSVVTSAASVMVVFWIISLLARKTIGKLGKDLNLQQACTVWAAGIIGALTLTFCSTFWTNATEAETYGPSILVMCLTIWAMLNWENTPSYAKKIRWLLLIAYLLGLSLGLRMFSLLTVPSLALIFYFKQTKHLSFRGTILALIVGGFIVMALYAGITLSLPTCAMYIEIFVVNQLGLPFKSGIIIFGLTVLTTLIVGLVYSLKKQKFTLHLTLLSISFVLIGYTTYGIVPIRAHANPPINEGNPSDIISFINYLKREQYGRRPLLYGPHFAAQVIGAKRGKPIYRNTGKKYEIIGHKHEPIFEEVGYTLLPRTWSQQTPMHVTAYRDILHLKPWQKPSFLDQIRFLVSYQIGYFYFRYFLWNFVGRTSDMQGASWLTPSATLNKVPVTLTKIFGRTNYLYLPLLLGLIGMVFQYKYDKRSFWALYILFLMLGVALVVFLNPPPIEPRERDYIYIGSFLTFTIWIGLGALAVIENLKKIFINSKIAIILGMVSCLSVPTIMATQGWHFHNRAQRYFSVDSGKNLLASCAPNAILFTSGDNDTYPLWYLQEVEGFRTDVRVIVLSYANAGWCIKQLIRQVNDSKPLTLSIPVAAYQQYGLNDILPYIPAPNVPEPLDVMQYIELIQASHPALRIRNTLGEATNTLPCRKICLTINKQEILTKGIVPQVHEALIPEKMMWTVKGRGLDKKDLLVLDLIATTNWERPIYFNHSSLQGLNIDLSENVITEGLALRLLPIQNTTAGTELVNTSTMYENVMKKFYWRGLDKPGIYYDENYRLAFIRNHRMMFCALAKALLQEEKVAQAKEVLLYSLSMMADKAVPYDVANVYMLHLLFEVGENEQALDIIHITGKRAQQILSATSPPSTFIDRNLQEQLTILYEITKSLLTAGYIELAEDYKELLYNYQSLLGVSGTYNELSKP
jgi:hypothetical protein